MQDDSNIPILTDLIEVKTEITQPEIELDDDRDMVIDDDDEPVFSFDPEQPESAMNSKAASEIGRNPELEQTIRRILDEHMELAWQEIRLAIDVSLDNEDESS